MSAVVRAAGKDSGANRPSARLDHENKKVPISRPTANAQSPRVQTEMTRVRLRRSTSCKASWDRSVIAAPLRAASHCRKIGVLANAVPNIPPHGCPKECNRRSRGITDLHKIGAGRRPSAAFAAGAASLTMRRTSAARASIANLHGARAPAPSWVQHRPLDQVTAADNISEGNVRLPVQ
jgi:hypothetical protein